MVFVFIRKIPTTIKSPRIENLKKKKYRKNKICNRAFKKNIYLSLPKERRRNSYLGGGRSIKFWHVIKNVFLLVEIKEQ